MATVHNDPDIFKSQLCPGAGKGFYIYITWDHCDCNGCIKMPCNDDWVIGARLAVLHTF